MRGQAAMLQFDWEEVNGTPVDEVVAKGARRLSDGSLECEEIALVLADRAVLLRVKEDTDEVIVTLESFDTDGTEWQPLDQFREIVSRRLGWCWVGPNYRGYLDTFTLAVDGIAPTFSFVGVASSLHCARVTSIAA